MSSPRSPQQIALFEALFQLRADLVLADEFGDLIDIWDLPVSVVEGPKHYVLETRRDIWRYQAAMHMGLRTRDVTAIAVQLEEVLDAEQGRLTIVTRWHEAAQEPLLARSYRVVYSGYEGPNGLRLNGVITTARENFLDRYAPSPKR